MNLDASGGDLALNAALVGATADLERATLAPAWNSIKKAANN